MDSRDNILSLLGLALRGGRLVMGEEPVEGVARARDARVLLLASDAADNTRRRIEHFADEGQCMWLWVPFTKEELGRALGRTSVAVAAITDIGLAAAVARRLADGVVTLPLYPDLPKEEVLLICRVIREVLRG